MTFKRALFVLVPTLLLFGGVFAAKYFGGQAMNAYFDNMPIPTASISAREPAQMTWPNEVESTGTVIAVHNTEVTTEAGGIVEKIHFESGQTVKRGDALVSLDAATQRGEYARLKAQAELARLNRERQEKLFELEAISRADLDAARAEADAARAALHAQAGVIAQKEIRAPFSGMLGIRKINLGQYLAPGTAIVSLQSTDPIDFEFSLPEQRLPQVQPGQSLSVRIDAYPDETFEGLVSAIEPRVDLSTRNFRLRARLANPDGRLRHGQFGQVTLALPGEREVLAVPRTAINYSSYGTSLFVVQAREPAEGAAAPAPQAETDEESLEVIQRFVKTGEARGDWVAISEGLEAGERVATSGLLKLRNHQPVSINNEVAPEASLDPQPAES